MYMFFLHFTNYPKPSQRTPHPPGASEGEKTRVNDSLIREPPHLRRVTCPLRAKVLTCNLGTIMPALRGSRELNQITYKNCLAQTVTQIIKPDYCIYFFQITLLKNI